MTINYNKCLCLICWKRFSAPSFIDNNHYLYFDKKQKDYTIWTWLNKDEKLDSFLSEYLDENIELQFKNDETRGRTAKQLTGFLADGDKEYFLFRRCPRCNYRLNIITGIEQKEIPLLTFNRFHSTSKEETKAFLVTLLQRGKH